MPTATQDRRDICSQKESPIIINRVYGAAFVKGRHVITNVNEPLNTPASLQISRLSECELTTISEHVARGELYGWRRSDVSPVTFYLNERARKFKYNFATVISGLGDLKFIKS